MTKQKKKKIFPFLLLLLLHLILLGWIFYVLSKAGGDSLGAIGMHFVGFSLYGGGLIWLSSFLARKAYRDEMREKH